MNRTITWLSRSAQYVYLRAILASLMAGLATFVVNPALSMVVDARTAATSTSANTTVSTIPQAAGGGLEIATTPGSALDSGAFDIVINPSGALAANILALTAFNRAAQHWESFISDPVTVTIDADYPTLGSGILGSSGAVYLQASYNTIRNQLAIDASDEPDDAIVLSMPTSTQFTAILPPGFALNNNLQATKANLKAIGFASLDTLFGVTDASIALSAAITWDFDRSDGISLGSFDFEGIAIHEIGHALGFVSTVDDIDALLPDASTEIQPAPFDLFRFRDNSASDPATPADFATFPRDMVPGFVGIFDQVLGGSGGDIETLLSTGIDHGDGRQASHWKDSLSLGIMDPTAAPGELLVLRANDLRVLDLIGYEIQIVPEVGSLTLLLIGSGLSVLGWRRR